MAKLYFSIKIIFLAISLSFSDSFLAAQDTSVQLYKGLLIDTTTSTFVIETPKYEADKKTIVGQASYYAKKFEGRKTANGEIFSHKKLTAACNVLPLGTWVEITNLRNNKKVIVKTNDRLHPRMKRVVDLTLAAAQKLDFVHAGLAKVKVVVLGKNYKPKK